jgi:hypothetical protein
MVSILERVLAESPFGAVFVVFWAGVVASLISCLLVRVPVIFGLVASKKRSIFMLLLIISGLIIGTIALGIIMRSSGSLNIKLFILTKYIYIIFGVLIILTGIFSTGLINMKFLHSYIPDKIKYIGYVGMFIFGMALALLKVPICGDSDPALTAIVSSLIVRNSLPYCVLVFAVFAIGQSLVPVIFGLSIDIIRHFAPKITQYDSYLRLMAGNILIVFGIYFILIA